MSRLRLFLPLFIDPLEICFSPQLGERQQFSHERKVLNVVLVEPRYLHQLGLFEQFFNNLDSPQTVPFRAPFVVLCWFRYCFQLFQQLLDFVNHFTPSYSKKGAA